MTIPTSPISGPWCTIDQVKNFINVDAIAPQLVTDCMMAASSCLYRLSGERWNGGISDTVRPCGFFEPTYAPPASSIWDSTSVSSRFAFFPWLIGGAAWCGCGERRNCGCQWVHEIRLPGEQIISIDEVVVHGVTIDPARYRVDDARYLVWVPFDGDNTGWPCCQSMAVDKNDVTAWFVTYTYGALPPIEAQLAAAAYTKEWLLACNPATLNQCQLPRRVTNISRQGVSAVLLDPLKIYMDASAQGFTGVPIVDAWLNSLNKRRRRASVVVPGQHGPNVRRQDTNA